MPRLRLLPPAVMATTPEECAPILDHLMKRGGAVAIDTETTGLDKMRDQVLFWSMATEDARWCFPANMLPFFDPIFHQPDVTWRMANAKYDLHLLKNMGIDLVGPAEDIITMDALVDDTRRHGLKEQAKLAYDVSWGDFKQLFLDPVVVSKVLGMDKDAARAFKAMGVGDKLLKVYEQAPDMVIEYASCDAFFTYMRGEDLTQELAAEELPVDIAPKFSTLLDYFTVIEKPLTKCLWRMERRGIAIDEDYIDKIAIPVLEGIDAMKKELCDIASKEHNPDSHHDVRKILYDDENFGLSPVLYTKGGKTGRSEPKASTNDQSLEYLLNRKAPESRAARYVVRLQDYRALGKLYRTYIKGIQKHIVDGRLHTSLTQHVTRTGRLSSTDPNLQNIPRPDKDSFLLRGAFVASRGKVLIDKDYPQIEFRVAAVNADDPKMLDAIRKGWDIHNANTANMFGLDYDEISAAKATHKDHQTDRQKHLLTKRQESKTVGLGTLFGEGARKMAAQLGLHLNEAYKLKDQFFETYPAIEQDIAFMHEYAHEFGYTFTMLGRKRRLYKINTEYGKWIVAEEERQAYNTWIQGSAAELMKLAMLQIDADPLMAQIGGELILPVHDELIMESDPSRAADVSDLMTDFMAHPLHWGPIQRSYPVPITPDGDIGRRWSDCH